MAFSNKYNILSFTPILELKKLGKLQKTLAETLISSGRLRISAENKRNFVILPFIYDDFQLTFSKREVFDPKLLPQTKEILAQALNKSRSRNPQESVSSEIENKLRYLKKELKKYIEISPEYELKLTLLFIQSAHPDVIKLIIKERTEIFISFSHSVEDLMSIREFSSHGSAGGLQKTDSAGSAIYVSCMGDPFLSKEYRTYTSDGFPALSRLVVIAAQEIGHFADLIRDRYGRYIGRFSTTNFQKPSEEVRLARKKDIESVNKIKSITEVNGLQKLVDIEREIKFFKTKKLSSRKRFFLNLRVKLLTSIFLSKTNSLKFIKYFPKTLLDENGANKEFANNLLTALNDMKFNLNPLGYEEKDEGYEEAVLCAEALARVPQQVVKWGHNATKFAWPNLYKIYYGKVIPACIKTLKNSS